MEKGPGRGKAAFFVFGEEEEGWRFFGGDGREKEKARPGKSGRVGFLAFRAFLPGG